MKKHAPFSEAYHDCLEAAYGPVITRAVTDDWQQASLGAQPGMSVAYIRVNQDASPKPIIYVPGFTESITAKAPFIAELAARGRDVIMPGQQRRGISRNPDTGRKDATHTQAEAVLSVLKASGVESVDAVAHSYGSLVLEAAVKLARARDQHYFDSSKMVLLAPAGLSNSENIVTLGPRFLRSATAEDGTVKDFGEYGREMQIAGLRNFGANPLRAVREALDAASRRLDYRSLREIGHVAILTYGQDSLYSNEIVKPVMQDAVEAGVIWASPISIEPRDRPPRLGEGSSHNDERFNPSRVAPAVIQMLETL